MNITIFKKILCIISYIAQSVHSEDITDVIWQQLQEDGSSVSFDALTDIMSYIQDKGFLQRDDMICDLLPSANVFAKAEEQTISEALALYECFIICNHMQYTKIYADPIACDLLCQTILLKKENNGFVINELLQDDVYAIQKEYETTSPIISSTLSAIYANQLLSIDETATYRNEESDIVPYDNLQDILTIIPRRGIPEDRNMTKPIHAFYKDTLMYEFQHSCPICGIDMPHLLIASHIKPFRDCAHIMEALDHNNGLLLCRNHDYLFDQGYITFDDDGRMHISKLLQTKKNIRTSYQLHPKQYLPKSFLTKNRILFLAYHRKHIFQNH